MAAELPVGKRVDDLDPSPAPSLENHTGRYVELVALDPDAHVAALYECSHDKPELERLWTYMPYGPFESQGAMHAWLKRCAAFEDRWFLTVLRREDGQPVGMVAFVALAAASRTVEVAHIWYSPRVQRTRVNTEAVYLMLRHAFDDMRCRRVEWKCDALNERSRHAALRLGFAFEGEFRKHRIVKGRSRDTAWYAMLDDDWPGVRDNIEAWLYENDHTSLSERQGVDVARARES